MTLAYTGGLQIQARKANGAYPVGGTSVRIVGAEEANRFVAYSVTTDEDGSSPTVILPAPDPIYSLSSGAAQAPYAIYDVQISKDGYYPKLISSVAIFPNTVAILPVNMIPLSEHEPLESYPRGNLSATVRENEYLE